MEELTEMMIKLDLESILRGVPLDLKNLSRDKFKILVCLAAHCIFNGPVGVNKNTNFPTGEVGSIKGLLGIPVTNSSWRELCRAFAEDLSGRDGLKPLIEKCASYRRNKKLWPLNV